MSLRTLLGAAGAAARRGARRRRGCSSSRASSSTRPRSTGFGPSPLDATFGAAEALEAACERLGRGGRGGGPRRQPALLLVTDAARGPSAPPVPSCSPSAPSTTGSSGRPAHAGVDRRRERRAARVAPLRVPARLRRRGDLPAPRARDRRGLAAADKLGGDHPSPARRSCASARRSRTACSRSCRRWASPTSRRYRGAQIFEAIGLAPRGRRRCFPGTPCPIGGIGFAELEREVARAAEAAARERRRSSRTPATSSTARAASRTRRARRSSTRCTRRSRRTLCGRRSTGGELGAATSGSPRSSTSARRSSRATCSSSSARTARPARRGRARRGRSCGASRAARMSHGALSAEAHETIAVALNRLGARGEHAARAARTRPASGTERNSRDQAGRLGPLRRHAGVRGLRRRAPDQDRAGLEARRGRPAPGHKVTTRSRACGTRSRASR